MKRIRFKYLFHGTSSVYRERIEEWGLLPINGTLYLTTEPWLAWTEAHWTVNGEDLSSGYKTAVGGKPLVVKVDREAVNHLSVDSPGWYDKGSSKVSRLVAKRIAFRTEKPVSPVSLSFIENFDAELQGFYDEIHAMTTLRLPFQYDPAVEAKIRAHLERRRNSQ